MQPAINRLKGVLRPRKKWGLEALLVLVDSVASEGVLINKNLSHDLIKYRLENIMLLVVKKLLMPGAYCDCKHPTSVIFLLLQPCTIISRLRLRILVIHLPVLVYV